MWLTLLKALLGLAGALAGYLRDRQMLDAGAAQAVAVGLQEAMSGLATARAAVDHARSDDGERERLRERARGNGGG